MSQPEKKSTRFTASERAAMQQRAKELKAEARFDPCDGLINAVVVRDLDRARDQTTRVNAAVATGAHLPLAGVPMTVKANMLRLRLEPVENGGTTCV